MDTQVLIYLFVGLSFALYIGIVIWSRAGTTKEFYVAGGHIPPSLNGMATAADWMSAASFISMAGIIAFAGYDGSVYLMGWTGGYVLLALLLAPYLRKFGQFTVPDFIGERYYSKTARVIGVICLIIISFTYVAGQMRGVGIVFSRFLEVDINTGVLIGMGAGQPNRVGSAKLCADQAGDAARGAVAATDALIPFPDTVTVCAEAGCTAVVHTGGSIRDDEVIAAANELGVSLVTTGVRHFRH